MTRSLAGPFEILDLGNGRWYLTGVTSAPVDLYLSSRGSGVGDALQIPRIEQLDLDWHVGGVSITIIRDRGVNRLEVDSALIHEPQQRLYSVLELAAFDPKAQRFWRRVFLLMRVPGGRVLLRLIARRKR